MKKTEELVDLIRDAEEAAPRHLWDSVEWRLPVIRVGVEKMVEEHRRYEKFTRWLIGEIIKGELDEEATLNKLAEFGFVEEKDGYISVRVEV